jgi:hypothetical protein
MDERKKRMNTQQHIRHLQHEITVLKGMIQEYGTGHIHTAIYVLENRIKELELLYQKKCLIHLILTAMGTGNDV